MAPCDIGYDVPTAWGRVAEVAIPRLWVGCRAWLGRGLVAALGFAGVAWGQEEPADPPIAPGPTAPPVDEAAPPVPAEDEAPDESTASTSDAAADGGKKLKPYKIGGIVIPLFNYNSTDGPGFGLGVDIFDRKRELNHGYRHRVSAWTFWATSGKYTSNYIQYEYRSFQLFIARVSYRQWQDMLYAGSGGEDVIFDRGREIEGGNKVLGPSLMLTSVLPIPQFPVYLWIQAYGRYNYAEATNQNGLLFQRNADPNYDVFGLGQAFTFDTAVGMAVQEVDRFPMPNKGVRFEGSARFGGTYDITNNNFEPLVGMNLELIGYWPIVGEYFTVGGRALFDKTWGRRPFWEQEWLGGQFRDENAYEQMVVGYARSRSRGDGILATMIELRAKVGQTRHPFFDIGFYPSVFAELAWLFEGDNPGPILPTVGVGLNLLWQGALQLRPYAAWGWVKTTENGPRYPTALFGISIMDPL